MERRLSWFMAVHCHHIIVSEYDDMYLSTTIDTTYSYSYFAFSWPWTEGHPRIVTPTGVHDGQGTKDYQKIVTRTGFEPVAFSV